MKLGTLALLLALPLFGLACEEEAPAPEEAAAPAAAQPAAPAEGQPAAAPAPSAVEICKGIVEAAKAKDDAKITAVATDGAAEALAGEGVKDHVYALLTDAVCGDETRTEDGTKSTVELTKGEEKIVLPFVKAADVLKFDVVAFIDKNPKKEDAKAKGKKGKKEKAKKGKKAKK